MISTILSRLVAQIFSAYGIELRTPDASCDPAMCRTTDGSDGFDCWADGVWEKFECADGYEVVKTSKSMVEFKCCRPDASCDPPMWGEKLECADGHEVVKTGGLLGHATCCPPSEDAVFERVCRHM
jgi:hypothetical protein